MLRTIAKWGLIVFVCLGAAGCIPDLKVDPNATVGSGRDAYLVMGAKPDNYIIYVGPGEVVSGEFHPDSEVSLLPPAMWRSGGVGYPKDGYVVVRVVGGSTLAVVRVQVESSLGLPGDIWNACVTPVFTVPAGKVVYVGDVVFQGGGQMTDRRASDFPAAKAYVAAHYPQLAPVLEQGEAHTMPTNMCPHRN